MLEKIKTLIRRIINPDKFKKYGLIDVISVIFSNVKIFDNIIMRAGGVAAKSLKSGIYVGHRCVLISPYKGYIQNQGGRISIKPDHDNIFKAATSQEKIKMILEAEQHNGGFVV